MNIIMATNTYYPHVGGVARSVSSTVQELRRLGHSVLVLAPTFEQYREDERDIIRVPAIQRFNGSDFSLPLPIPGGLIESLELFAPDLIHSHHSFLLGDTALRIAAAANIPLVFTHHTMYEHYTHYVPGDSKALKAYVKDLTTAYANMCDLVIAPSNSIARILISRSVTSKIVTIPTGIDLRGFKSLKANALRNKLKLNRETKIIGHVGRLAEEKNVEFLSLAVCQFLSSDEKAIFLIVGSGSASKQIIKIFERFQLSERLYLLGTLDGEELLQAYASIDLFVFASKTETQGLVIAESMAAGVPVVALEAPGVDDVIVDNKNGFLLRVQDPKQFASKIQAFFNLAEADKENLRLAAIETSHRFSLESTVKELLSNYIELSHSYERKSNRDRSVFEDVIRLLNREMEIWSNRAHALGQALPNLGQPESTS